MEEEEDREVIDGAMEGGCETLEMLKEFENVVMLVECSAAGDTVIAPCVIKHEEEVEATGLTDDGDTVDGDDDIVAVVNFDAKLVTEAGNEKGLLFLTTIAWGGRPEATDTGLLTIAI